MDDEYHLKVHSPILRDIIIRSCVQIEIFFKEWAKYECSVYNDISLYKEYNEIDKKTKSVKGERNWNFKSYFYFKSKLKDARLVYVRPMRKNISPFKTWTSGKMPPFWWESYNAIKHNGIASKKDANLKNALYSLSALFQLHCINNYSREFLDDYKDVTLISFVNSVKVKFHSISSPVDSKRYLFKEEHSSDKEIELVTIKKLN